MKVKFEIPLSYNPIDANELHSVLQNYSDRHHDDLITDFEEALCKITGAKHAVALNSGTAGIHLGLHALGVKQDDVVMVSTFTYVGSINPICYLGAVPFFVDSSADDWNIDPELLEKGILRCIASGKKPKAILVVHTYGMPAKMKQIMAIAVRYQIPVLEDAAEAFGATYHTQPLGTFGEIGVLSFNNNKLNSTYGGGALLTNNPEIEAKVRFWASQSRDNVPYYHHREIGFNYKMGPLNAAAGLAQVGLLKERVNHRRSLFDFYRSLLNDKVVWQTEDEGFFSNRWITAVRFHTMVNVSEIQSEFASNKIEIRPLWKPMHLQPVFSLFESNLNGNAEMLFKSGFCLPSGNDLNEIQIKYIAGFLEGYLG